MEKGSINERVSEGKENLSNKKSNVTKGPLLEYEKSLETTEESDDDYEKKKKKKGEGETRGGRKYDELCIERVETRVKFMIEPLKKEKDVRQTGLSGKEGGEDKNLAEKGKTRGKGDRRSGWGQDAI